MPRWLTALVLLIGAGALVGALASAADTGTPAGERAVGAFSLLVIAALLAGVATVFDELDVRVDGRGLRFGFGPFRRTLAPAELREAHVERYPWLRFGGWGLRWSITRGPREQAYSVPLLRAGVAIELRDGRRYHLSSRHPDELAGAINVLVSGNAGGAA